MIIILIFILLTFSCLFYIFFHEAERYKTLIKIQNDKETENIEYQPDKTYSRFPKWDIENPGKNNYNKNNRKRGIF